MHARPARPRRKRAVTMMLEDREFQAIEHAAGNLDLGPFCRRIVMGRLSSKLDCPDRLILAEVCATRKEVEDLLVAISDLNGQDIERARAGADRLRHASVQRRLLELRQEEIFENA